jgi:hypothetical protein
VKSVAGDVIHLFRVLSFFLAKRRTPCLILGHLGPARLAVLMTGTSAFLLCIGE